MEKFIIIDWANNHINPKKEFDTFEDGWEFIYLTVDDEEAYQDLFVIPKSDYKPN